MSLKRGSVAVVGAAESDLGQVAPNTSPVDLMAQATGYSRRPPRCEPPR